MSGAPRVALAGPFPPPYGGMAAYFAGLEHGLKAEGVASRRIPIRSGSPSIRATSFIGAALRIRRTDADVVHCITGSQSNLLANGLLLVAARRSVLSIVGGEFHGAATGGSAFRRRLMRRVVSLPDRVVACNAEIAEALELLGVPAARIVVLSNALPAQSGGFASSSESDAAFGEFAERCRPLVTSVSGWYEHYGSMDLLRAVAALRDRHPRVGVVLVIKEGGDAAFADSVRAWIREHGLADRVLILTNVPSVPAIMARSDVFVRTPHIEGDSISVREALATGLPVVASDAGFRPAGITLFRPADAVDLTDKLEQVLAQPRQEATGDLAVEARANLERLVQIYRDVTAS